MRRLMKRQLVIVLALGMPIAALAQSSGDRTTADAAAGRSRADEVAALEPAVNTSARPAPASTPAASAETPSGSPAAQAERALVSASSPAARPVAAIDRLDLGTTSITGNQELPKVLYIVPWKRSDLGDLIGRPVNTLLDEVLAPVDPEVFERHLSYYETLHGESQEE